MDQLIKQFEGMKETAELNALRKISLERPLKDEEFKKMVELGDKFLEGLQ